MGCGVASDFFAGAFPGAPALPAQQPAAAFSCPAHPAFDVSAEEHPTDPGFHVPSFFICSNFPRCSGVSISSALASYGTMDSSTLAWIAAQSARSGATCSSAVKYTPAIFSATPASTPNAWTYASARCWAFRSASDLPVALSCACSVFPMSTATALNIQIVLFMCSLFGVPKVHSCHRISYPWHHAPVVRWHPTCRVRSGRAG